MMWKRKDGVLHKFLQLAAWMCTFGMLLAAAGCEGRQTEETNQDSLMEVHFIDVGQGDATLVKCGSEALLIDAGDDSKGTLVQNYLRKQGVEKLDYLILTHAQEKIGGILDEIQTA